MTTRRLFLAGAASLLAAPSIVRASSLMALPVQRVTRGQETASAMAVLQRSARESLERLFPTDASSWGAAMQAIVSLQGASQARLVRAGLIRFGANVDYRHQPT